MSNQFHLIAPDYSGFGNSDTPPIDQFAIDQFAIDQFEYSFDHLADITDHFLKELRLNQFSLYVQDYGAPVGFRIATRHPEWIQALIAQGTSEAIEVSPAGSQFAAFEWPSRRDFLNYWHSNEYAAIKKLREGAVEFQGAIVAGVAG